MRIAHLPRGFGDGGLGRAAHRLLRQKIGDLHRRDGIGAGLAAAHAVEEAREGGGILRQLSELFDRQFQQHGLGGGARGGRGQTVAHQPALAKGVARTEDRDQRPVLIGHFDRSALDQIDALERLAIGIDGLARG